jgi:HPr kinase/phosphorylase
MDSPDRGRVALHGPARSARKRSGVEIQVHGALVQVLGVGVLLRGASGIGKSECALELVQRGHRLVADDVVRIRSVESPSDAEPESTGKALEPQLQGRAPELIRHHMEIRGIGLLYIPDLYGAESVLQEAGVELICQLEHWREDTNYERIGLERATETLAGVAIPIVVLPVRPAGSMATLVEVMIRDYIQRCAGVNAAQRLDDRLARQARARSSRFDGEAKTAAGFEATGSEPSLAEEEVEGEMEKVKEDEGAVAGE